MNNCCLLSELEVNEFFRYTKPEDLEGLRQQILEEGWPAIFGESGRLFSADAEALAEGGIPAFVDQLATFLSFQGIEVPSLSTCLGEDYVLAGSGKYIKIWTQIDYERDLSGEFGLCWGLSAARTVQMLNKWLEAAGSVERAYGVNGGNDFVVFFLTDKLYTIIVGDPQASLEYGPYTPTLDYPRFGQPIG